VLLQALFCAGGLKNRLWHGNLQVLKDLRDILIYLVAPKESVWACLKLNGLKLREGMSDGGPCFPAGQLGGSLDEKGKSADFDMGFNSVRQPVIDRGEMDLRAFECSKATLDDHEIFVPTGCVLDVEGVVIGDENPFPVVFLCLADLLGGEADFSRRTDGEIP
jgi:hypothetical protein